MSAAPADLTIEPRWILPMTSPHVLLEQHALVVRDGRIIDVLPRELAAERYAATLHVERPEHLLLPGLVNARTQIVPRVANATSAAHVTDTGLLGIAAMLRAGTSSFCATGFFPDVSARLAAAQGMRAIIGIPLAAHPSPWARQADEYLSRALTFRDELAGHPNLVTAFAPHDATAIGDALFGRIATLANELDLGVLISLHESAAAVERCVAQHGLRPIERLHALGLLTPALTAADMVHVDAADVALAQRSGVAITLCPESNLRSGFGPPPVATWARTELRLSLGTGAAAAGSAPDLWSALRLLGLLAGARNSANDGAADGIGLGAWEVLAAATRGAAAALGLEAEIGTLETGKWADLCCVDLHGAAMVHAAMPACSSAQPTAAERLVFGGGRDSVSDVWVAGRHLLNGGAFTRLDWPALASRIAARPARPMTGDS